MKRVGTVSEKETPPQQTEALCEAQSADRDLCHVIPVSGRGFGTVASCDIPGGTLIIEEEPLLRVGVYEGMSDHEFAASVRAAAARLSAHDANVFHRLACATQPITPEGVFHVNNFRVDSDQVVYTRISRVNHSCAPNCAHSYDSGRGVGQIRALRDIAVGEELYISYTELRAPRRVRQQHLRQMYNFECSCDVCTAADSTSDCCRQVLFEFCEMLTPHGSIIETFNLLEEASPTNGKKKSKKLTKMIDNSDQARSLGVRVAARILQLVDAEGLVGINDCAAHACVAATYLLAGHPDVQARWAEECLSRMRCGGSKGDLESMSASLTNIQARPASPLLPSLSSDKASASGPHALPSISRDGLADAVREALPLLRLCRNFCTESVIGQ